MSRLLLQPRSQDPLEKGSRFSLSLFLPIPTTRRKREDPGNEVATSTAQNRSKLDYVRQGLFRE